jgi:hypothetical protein
MVLRGRDKSDGGEPELARQPHGDHGAGNFPRRAAARESLRRSLLNKSGEGSWKGVLWSGVAKREAEGRLI